jgi:hypothetical protein
MTSPEALKNGAITLSIPPPIGPSISICHCQFRLTVICLGFASSALGTSTGGFHLDKWLGSRYALGV